MSAGDLSRLMSVCRWDGRSLKDLLAFAGVCRWECIVKSIGGYPRTQETGSKQQRYGRRSKCGIIADIG